MLHNQRREAQSYLISPQPTKFKHYQPISIFTTSACTQLLEDLSSPTSPNFPATHPSINTMDSETNLNEPSNSSKSSTTFLSNSPINNNNSIDSSSNNGNGSSSSFKTDIHLAPIQSLLNNSTEIIPLSPNQLHPNHSYSKNIPLSLQVIHSTFRVGEEGTPIIIHLHSSALLPSTADSNSPSTSSIPNFGSTSPLSSNSLNTNPINRRFIISFNNHQVPTTFGRSQRIEALGINSTGEEDSFVVLSAFAPRREVLKNGEKVLVSVLVVNDIGRVIDSILIGEWETPDSHPNSPSRQRKRLGDDLYSDRIGPNEFNQNLNVQSNQRTHSPIQRIASPSNQLSPSVTSEEKSPSALRHPPANEINEHAPIQPELTRTSQINITPSPFSSNTNNNNNNTSGNSSGGGSGSAATSNNTTTNVATYSNKATLKLQGDLNSMAMGWSNEEWTDRRRLVQFWRQQEGNIINATFRPIDQINFVPNSIVISCIFRDDWNECFVTSVDAIYLLEALVGVRFTVEEKNRIRRNLEGFKPVTISKTSKTGYEGESFFKLIMNFPNPKPRNIEKDVKVFPWKVLSSALKKIISKYSATFTVDLTDSSLAESNAEELLQLPHASGSGSGSGSSASQPSTNYSLPIQQSHSPDTPELSSGSSSIKSRPADFEFVEHLTINTSNDLNAYGSPPLASPTHPHSLSLPPPPPSLQVSHRNSFEGVAADFHSNSSPNLSGLYTSPIGFGNMPLPSTSNIASINSNNSNSNSERVRSASLGHRSSLPSTSTSNLSYSAMQQQQNQNQNQGEYGFVNNSTYYSNNQHNWEQNGHSQSFNQNQYQPQNHHQEIPAIAAARRSSYHSFTTGIDGINERELEALIPSPITMATGDLFDANSRNLDEFVSDPDQKL